MEMKESQTTKKGSAATVIGNPDTPSDPQRVGGSQPDIGLEVQEVATELLEYKGDAWERLPFGRKIGGLAFLVFVWGLFLYCIGGLDRPEVIASSILGLAVGFLALNQYYVAKKQWWVMSSQEKRMVEQRDAMIAALKRTDSLLDQNERMIGHVGEQANHAGQQVKIMKAQLKSMDRQLMLMEDANFVANRGHLSLHAFSVPVLEIGKMIQLMATWNNDGNSSLEILDYGYVKAKIQEDPPYKDGFAAGGFDIVPNSLTIAPHSPRHQGFNFPHILTIDEWNAIDAGDSVLALYVEIIYKTLGRTERLSFATYWHKGAQHWLDARNQQQNPN